MSEKKVNLNKEIMALFSGQSNSITTPRLYVQLTGNLSLAVVLNQCVFWSNKSKLKNGWFYKNYQEWFEEINMPERTLRRRFDRLEQLKFIITKIKKVQGVNAKHIYTNMDVIIDSIQNMLDIDCPDRPNWPTGIEKEQKTCTKSVPTGQTGRSEPAKVAVPNRPNWPIVLYTEENLSDDYKQMCVGDTVSSPASLVTSTPLTHTIFEDYKKQEQENLSTAVATSKHQEIEASALIDADNVELFAQRFTGRDITIDRLFRACQEHYGSKGQCVGSQRFYTWIKNERLENHAKIENPVTGGNGNPINPLPAMRSVFSEDDIKILGDYRHAIKINAMNPKMDMIAIMFPDPAKLTHAKELHERDVALKATSSNQPAVDVRGSKGVAPVVQKMDCPIARREQETEARKREEIACAGNFKMLLGQVANRLTQNSR